MPIGEVYGALQTGLVDCVHTDLSSGWSYKLHESADGFARMKMGIPIKLPIMNRETWDGLSPDLQQIVIEACKNGAEDWRTYAISNSYIEKDVERTLQAKPEYVFFFPTSEERAEWSKLAEETAWKEFIKLGGDDAAKIVDIVNKTK